MFNQILEPFRKKYQTLNTIELSSTNLINNYQYLANLNRNFKIAPVLKSNAYGHGITQIAQILDPLKTPFFCVDSLYEAYQLQKVHIKTPILIMGYTDPVNFKVKKLPFSFAVYDLKTVKILNEYQSGAGIHLKIDTGMHRLGIPFQDLPKFLSQLKKYKNLKVEGIMSHLASSQDDDPLFQHQMENFKKALEMVKKAGFDPKWTHIASSQALLNKEIRSEIYQVSNMARIGLALYGITENPNQKLQPVLKLHTKITQIKILRKGDRVGYDGTFQAPKKMVLGVLPIGYFDGVDRRLSNLGTVQVNGVNCPIVGRVSMNITTINISKVKNPKLGQQVIVFSHNSKDKNSILQSCKICQTIPYDLLVHLDSSIKKVVV